MSEETTTEGLGRDWPEVKRSPYKGLPECPCCGTDIGKEEAHELRAERDHYRSAYEGLVEVVRDAVHDLEAPEMTDQVLGELRAALSTPTPADA